MSHTVKEKKKLLDRVRRIRGQVESIERALTGEKDCTVILQTIAACRGAINGLMAQVVEGHIREHVVDPRSATAAQLESAEELIDVLHSYIK